MDSDTVRVGSPNQTEIGMKENGVLEKLMGLELMKPQIVIDTKVHLETH